MRALVTIACTLALATGNAYAAKKPKPIPIPTFSAKSYLVADDSGNILTEKDGNEVRSIASISKLMIGILASEQDLNEELNILKTREVSSTIPRKVTQLTRKELLTLALVRSDNFAAQILCLNLENCVEKMNERASTLEMHDTKFYEPTGLDYGNVSTARDLLKMLLVAANNSVITELSSLPAAQIRAQGRLISVHNTNPLTSKFSIILSKTGFTNAAGGCLVMIMNSSVGKRILILLGSRNTRTRILDMEQLVREQEK